MRASPQGALGTVAGTDVRNAAELRVPAPALLGGGGLFRTARHSHFRASTGCAEIDFSGWFLSQPLQVEVLYKGLI